MMHKLKVLNYMIIIYLKPMKKILREQQPWGRPSNGQRVDELSKGLCEKRQTRKEVRERQREIEKERGRGRWIER